MDDGREMLIGASQRVVNLCKQRKERQAVKNFKKLMEKVKCELGIKRS